MKKLLVLIVILGLLGAAASTRLLVFGAEKGASVSEASLFTVRQGNVEIMINENGYLKAKNNLEIKPKFKGHGSVTWLIEEGETVEPEDLLIEFDKVDLENKILELENGLIQYEIELEAASANLQIQERDNEATIEKAELALEMAQLTLERYDQGESPNELRKKHLAVEKTTSELERAEDRFKEVPELVKQGFLTKIQEEEERIRVREAQINKENAIRDLELYEQYTTHMELTQKKSNVKDAERALLNAREKAGINLKEKQARMAQKERQVNSTTQRLEQEREQLTYYTVKAERQGVVHYGDPARPWTRDRVKVGENFHKGSTILTIPDLSEMQVLIQVHVADIDLIEEGMDVAVTIETNKGKTFPAKITSVASVASSDSWMDQQNKSFRVEVTLEPYEEELRAGVTAKADIRVDELEDVIYIPIHAAFPESGKHYCFVYADGQIERRQVEIGKNNTHHVVIVSGIEAGERVLLYDPREDRGVVEEEAGVEETDDAGLTGGLANLGGEE